VKFNFLFFSFYAGKSKSANHQSERQLFEQGEKVPINQILAQ
jgi:hypothetical protein